MPAKHQATVAESHVAATFLIGRAVRKEFKNCGIFKGRVSDFHRDTGFRIEYEDGDTEDLTESALVSCTLTLAVLKRFCCAHCSACDLAAQDSRRR